MSSRGGRTLDDEEEGFQFLQIFDIGNEGLARKEINVVVEIADKVLVYKITPLKLKEVWVFKIVEKTKFCKN